MTLQGKHEVGGCSNEARWRDRAGDIEVTFLGRQPRPGPLARIAYRLAPRARSAAWLEQVHGDCVRSARPGFCGRGDGLVAEAACHVPMVVTADCVPVLVAAGNGLAAVHAGWRGIVAGVVGATIGRLEARSGLDGAVAWIGPAAAACCYEVSHAVAAAVVAVSTPAIAQPTAARPRLDLAAAVRHQLLRAGVDNVRLSGICTCCSPHWWSYRREGPGAGRNVALIWRREPGAQTA